MIEYLITVKDMETREPLFGYRSELLPLVGDLIFWSTADRCVKVKARVLNTKSTLYVELLVKQ